jgi:hypothetical protein
LCSRFEIEVFRGEAAGGVRDERKPDAIVANADAEMVAILR